MISPFTHPTWEGSAIELEFTGTSESSKAIKKWILIKRFNYSILLHLHFQHKMKHRTYELIFHFQIHQQLPTLQKI